MNLFARLPHLQRYFLLCRFVEGFLQCRKHRRACRQRRGQTSPQAAIRSQSTSYTFSVWFVLSLYFSFYSPSVCAYTHYFIYFILYIQSKQSFYWTICKFFQKYSLCHSEEQHRCGVGIKAKPHFAMPDSHAIALNDERKFFQKIPKFR